MKVPITIKIDHNKKQLFESTKEIHGLTFTDAMDEVITEYLSKITPSKLIEQEITKTEESLTKLKENLLKVESIQNQIKDDTNPLRPADKHLIKIREEKYKEHKQSIKAQIKNNSISWKKIAEVFIFKNKMDAQIWIMDKIEQDKEHQNAKMPKTNNKPWSRSTKVHLKRQSFNSYIEGAAEWAKKNRTTQCKTCGARTAHTAAKIEGNNIITTFTCGTGHITTQTTGENELRRAYNAQYPKERNRYDTPDRNPIERAEEKAFGEHFEEAECTEQ